MSTNILAEGYTIIILKTFSSLNLIICIWNDTSVTLFHALKTRFCYIFRRRYGANEIFFIILKRINTIQLPPHYIVFIKNPKSILQFWTIFWKYACIFVEFNSNVRVCYLTRISWVFRKQMHVDSIENHYKYPTKLEIPKYVQTWKNRVSYMTRTEIA